MLSLGIVLFIGHVFGAEDSEIIDLSNRLKTDETLYYPGYPEGYKSENVWNGTNIMGHGVWVEANKFEMVIHVGTHMDAPCHFCSDPKCWRLHQVPFERFIGPAAVIDISRQAAANPNYEMTVADIQAWEAEHGPVPQGAVLLMNAGVGDRWPDWEAYWGTASRDAKVVHDEGKWPGMTHEAAQYIVDNMDVISVGSDWGAVDSALSARLESSDKFKCHQIFLKNNILLLEYVNSNLAKLPPLGYTVYTLPLKLHDTCGSPIRMFAIKNPPSSASHMGGAWLVIFLAFFHLYI